MIEFAKYAKIKDNYCVCYFGPSDAYLLQLKLLKPIIERHFDGLKIFIGCRDEKVHILNGCEDVLKITDLKIRCHDFAHINELRFDMQTHPLEKLMDASGIDSWIVSTEQKKDPLKKAIIITKGEYPTRNLELREIDQLQKNVKEEGYEPEVDGNINTAGLVVGVESYAIFAAAAKGIKTRLIPSGLGTRLYKQMFQDAEIMHS